MLKEGGGECRGGRGGGRHGHGDRIGIWNMECIGIGNCKMLEVRVLLLTHELSSGGELRVP